MTDNGIGFDQKFGNNIFDTFTRLNNRNRFDGTGPGLSLCKKTIERHKRTITASGEVNKGATFIISLPVRQSDQML